MVFWKKKNPPVDKKAIHRFWGWFARNAGQIASLLDSGNSSALASFITPEIQRLHMRLDWEVGPGKSKPYMLTISSKSDRSLRPATDRIVDAAPSLPDWEFFPALQPHEPSPVIISDDGRVRIQTKWMFHPEYDAQTGRVNITLIDHALSKVSENHALHAASIVLDALLGEDGVEACIGSIQIAFDEDENLQPSYPIREILNYVSRKKQ